MQRVVSRSDLESEQPSALDSEADLNQDITAPLNNLDDLEFVEANLQTAENKTEDAEDEELAFQLFAAPKLTTNKGETKGLQKIRLRSPSVENSEPGFIRAERDKSYYFTSTLSPSDKENLKFSALTGKQVEELSRSYRPGSAYEWKVLNLPSSSLAKPIRNGNVSAFRRLVDSDEAKKRRRPGKKTRVKVRVKQETAEKQRIASRAATEAKEAADKEKRTKRNREKKAKKRMRDKAKLAEANSQTVSPHTNG